VGSRWVLSVAPDEDEEDYPGDLRIRLSVSNRSDE